MKVQKKPGIWLDHAAVNLMDISPAKLSHSYLTSKFTYEVQDDAIHKNEKLMHNKRQQMQKAYYREIANEILKYDHVPLFGPTHAKTELYNYLNEDMNFRVIKIEVESTDKMSDIEKTSM